jgi:hypothetical protein
MRISFVALLVIAAADSARSFAPPQATTPDDHAVRARAG